jgi:hypothetical protein
MKTFNEENDFRADIRIWDFRDTKQKGLPLGHDVRSRIRQEQGTRRFVTWSYVFVTQIILTNIAHVGKPAYKIIVKAPSAFADNREYFFGVWKRNASLRHCVTDFRSATARQNEISVWEKSK